MTDETEPLRDAPHPWDAALADGRLQDVVDAATAWFDLPAAIDTRDFLVLAYGEHQEQYDPMRLASLLKRSPSPALVRWLVGLGIETSRHPVPVPANPEFGAHVPRLCVPIRRGEQLLGYLWFIGHELNLTDEQLRVAQEFADAAAVIMHHNLELRDGISWRRRESLRRLLSHDRKQREAAFTDLGLDRDDWMAVLTCRVSTAAASQRGLEHAIARIERQALPSTAFAVPEPDNVVIVVAIQAPQAGRAVEKLDEIAAGVHRVVANEVQQGGTPTVAVAAGGVGQGPDAARASQRQAEATALVASRILGDPAVTRWADLGIYQFLASASTVVDDVGLIHPGLLALLEHRRAGALVPTLERYLHNACDVQTTARELFLHRTTLYTRLERIEELTGSDLRSGNDRLQLHLALKMARLVIPDRFSEIDDAPQGADASRRDQQAG